ncbi:MAG: acyl-CoA dehydrogenase family protein [Bdellovibrionia bacterium]
MDFVTTTDDEKQILQLADDFATREIKPVAEKYDKLAQFPMEVMKKARELGLANAVIPQAYGGPELSNLIRAQINERCARACTGITGALFLNNLIAEVLLIAGNETQKKTYLPRMVEGQIASYCVTEPGAGSDVGALRTTAVKKGDEYILNGSKTWISNAPVANFFAIFAKTDPAGGHKGLSVFLAEAGTPGLTVGKNLTKLGQRAFPACELHIENVKVPAKNLLGKEGDGFMIAMKAFDGSRPMVAAMGVGLSQRCLDEATAYAKTRQTMGVPLFHHQLISLKLAEMGMRTHASRLLTYESSDRLDRGVRNTLQAAYAKTFATDTAQWASSEAIQIFGGMGYSTEFPVEKLYRDAKVLQIYEGANEIQRLIMARELTR